MTRSSFRPPTDERDVPRLLLTPNPGISPESSVDVDGQAAEIDPRIASAAGGNREAAQGLLLELLPRVRNLVRYLIRGDADVDDMTQVVLLELLKSFGSYKGSGSLKAWTDRITVRVTLRRHKQASFHREKMTAAAVELQVVEPKMSTVDEYMTRRQVARVLDDVPVEQRQALVLHHVVGLSVPEVAEELGIPGETVRSRLRLGMGKLRAQYSVEEDT